MKKKYLKTVLILALLILATPAFSKKIKFGEYVVYNGIVKNELPAGKGKLTITHPNNKKTEPAICMGDFDEWRLQGTIEFYSKEGLPSFTGKAELSVAADGTCVTYHLIDGVYKDEKHINGIQITTDHSFTITCNIKNDIELSSNEIVLSEQISYAKYGDFSPLNIRTLTEALGGGESPKFFKHSTCCIQTDKVLSEVKYHETADFGNSMTAYMNKEKIAFSFKDGDSYIYKSEQIVPISFQKHYSDGVISLNANEKVLRFEDGQNRKGVASVPTTADVFETILISKTLAGTKLRVFYDELATLFEKAQNGNQEAANQLKEKTTLIAMEQVKAERRKSKIGKELMEIGTAYKSGNTKTGGLYEKLVEKGAMSNTIPVSLDSALVWTRMAADANEIYKSDVKELETEMGINVEQTIQEPVVNTKSAPVYVGNSSKLFAEAKNLTKGGDFIDMAYKVTVPIDFLMELRNNVPVPNSGVMCKGQGLKATLEVVPFGRDGNTILLDLDMGPLESPNLPNQTISWSGKNVHLAPGEIEGTNALVIVRGNNIVCGTILLMDGVWMVGISNSTEAAKVSTLKRGQARAEVERELSEIRLGQFKFSRKSGNLDVYSFYWLQQKDYYDYRKHRDAALLTNDKRYADFYFDSKGRLVKWIFLL